MAVGGTVTEPRVSYTHWDEPDRPRRRRRWAVVFVVLAVVAGAYRAYLAETTIEPIGAGFVVTPAGRLTFEDDTPVLKYPGGTAPDITVRLPIRNTGPVALTVTHSTNLAPPPLQDWPTRTVRVPAGGTAELTFTYSSGHCRVKEISDGSWFQVHTSLHVQVHGPGLPMREYGLALPLGLHVPGLTVVDYCPAP